MEDEWVGGEGKGFERTTPAGRSFELIRARGGVPKRSNATILHNLVWFEFQQKKLLFPFRSHSKRLDTGCLYAPWPAAYVLEPIGGGKAGKTTTAKGETLFPWLMGWVDA